MNCQTVAENIDLLVAGKLAPQQRDECRAHAASCRDCADMLRGAEAMLLIRERDTGSAPADLFERTLDRATRRQRAGSGQARFWLGAGFGGAIAASLLAVAMSLGWLAPATVQVAPANEFLITLDQPRDMNIAIDTDRALTGATISILLAGDVELDGFGSRRELTWNTDLEAGVNKLTLPVRAIGAEGGQLVVRMSHPQSEQVYVVNLKIDG
ncbi:MAG: zf-HC2 domain-containing protein [Gammaproteobacteria bacterium]|nr:zf-HC2 domain-containing protein [Gammaproteobacteria bacterium]MDH4253399.1 zf-HC2 domain-containing protein [Gammaproteobacteria bacterium]MDH5310290.1 zf-HC2 domain-containing protein [Gammaproteobacteria bacterium]